MFRMYPVVFSWHSFKTVIVDTSVFNKSTFILSDRFPYKNSSPNAKSSVSCDIRNTYNICSTTNEKKKIVAVNYYNTKTPVNRPELFQMF